MEDYTTYYIVGGVIFAFVIIFSIFLYIALTLRVVVPTNMVHIVQRAKTTTSYGRGKAAGNVYYAFPEWIPVIGLSTIDFPESNFDVNLSDYEAYDAERLPFLVDISAFFRIDDSEIAAQRISSFPELKDQLLIVLQGSVRRILATNRLEGIMEGRSELGEQFTLEVAEQIKEWGVVTVKSIEFMDIKDSRANNSTVIANIMAKEQSRIDRESRIVVAENNKEAQIKEINTKKEVEIQNQEAIQLVGQRTANAEKEIGISQEQSKQQILLEAKITTENEMAVKMVNEVKTAEIAKETEIIKTQQEKITAELRAEAEKQVQITTAEGDRASKVTRAVGDKESMIKIAEGEKQSADLNSQAIRAVGIAQGEADQAILMAPVNSQIILAKEIGENQNYQDYLIKIEQIKGQVEIGTAMSKALEQADIKVISNGQDNKLAGISKIADTFTTSNGGLGLSSMLSGFAASDEGKQILDKFLGKPADAEDITSPQTRTFTD